MCIMGLFYGKAMWSFIMRPEFTGNYCLGEFSWTAIFLSFLASWLFEISMDHRKILLKSRSPQASWVRNISMGQCHRKKNVLNSKIMRCIF